MEFVLKVFIVLQKLFFHSCNAQKVINAQKVQEVLSFAHLGIINQMRANTIVLFVRQVSIVIHHWDQSLTLLNFHVQKVTIAYRALDPKVNASVLLAISVTK